MPLSCWNYRNYCRVRPELAPFFVIYLLVSAVVLMTSETIEVPSRYLRRIKRGGRYLPLILKPYLLNFFSYQIRAEIVRARGNMRCKELRSQN